ncbi:hypothetical protein [Candidatus Marithrix sp. Canyon 246]|uniref:hypothetical protein n=1 Tax=Candidatus Marithrix sp. Canyon 246 TaxID=1827136 RepID=UPI00084A0C82|nr:hypothetical protein [Candidatus Marithrix sp. Canyon 246]
MKIATSLSASLIATSFFWSSNTFAVNKWDTVYGVSGNNNSNLQILEGYVTDPGYNNSVVHWYSCDCNKLVSNSSLWYSQSSAQEYVDKMDSEHTSVGEAAGVAAGLGLFYLFLKSQE